MRVVVQRVSSASVTIDGKEFSSVGKGLLVFIGITNDDGYEDIGWLCRKIVSMRIFPDHEGKMNLDVMQANGDVLAVSQFTLFASTVKGNRPSFIASAPPAVSQPLYDAFVAKLSELMQRQCKTGVFGADMKVSLINDGPVTITLDSRNRE